MNHTRSLLVNLSVLLDKPTGISVYAANIAPYLSDFDPTFLSARSLTTGDRYPIPANLSPAFGTAGHLRRLWWTQFQLPRIYRQCRASLLFSPVPESPLWSRCRSVVTVHDLIPLRFPRRCSPLLPYFRYYIPQVAARAEHVLCNSEATARDVVKWFGVPARQVTAIPLAFDRDRFRPLDLPQQPYFLYVGRHDPHKNLQRALQAFAQIPHRRQLEFWLAGPSDPRYTPQLKQLATELEIAPQLRFLDYVPEEELPALYNQALALVFPSLWEGFGLPLLEAMACGTPAIASNLASLPEVAGDAALLVDPYNIDSLARSMQEVADNGQLRAQLRQAGLSRAAQFSWESTGRATAAVLRDHL
ncbi:glycosyltransferase family 1 protein [Synechococcus sp. PCC 7336]|uniref:glycosyltransferase family 4 protein n=1 Tax=Synechococcus sp. PCC 7336 TaxID=195250 RepID=UPI000382DE22|nr:glycosyltransferase family 1 protein [Synechococcus sp. PCC 7336]